MGQPRTSIARVLPTSIARYLLRIGRGGKIAWPLRSPDLTPLDFSVWEYVKDRGFVPPLPASLEELQARITEAVVTVDKDIIDGIWKEISYK